MKNIVVFMITLSCIIFLTGCATKPLPPTESFEEKHAKDMEHKMHEEETSSTGENISTIQLLTPANPLTITETIVEYTS